MAEEERNTCTIDDVKPEELEDSSARLGWTQAKVTRYVALSFEAIAEPEIIGNKPLST